MPVEVWIFILACALVCALLVGLGMDLYQRSRAVGPEAVEIGDDEGRVE